MKKSKVVRGGGLLAAAAMQCGSADALTVDVRVSDGSIPVGQVGGPTDGDAEFCPARRQSAR
nr:hypothetical protein [Kibdelosporangium sp. MJ126-NF4]CEL18213.1 hypothetical protein [Kibdelosporangium sp. MJ126-NF4]CTQ90556.1 hypothetical protein [Kibdelosporangium sp. MJ126-NF4]